MAEKRSSSPPAPAKALTDAVRRALEGNKGVSGWTLRAIVTRSREMYLTRGEIESIRSIESPQVQATVYTTSGEEMGSAQFTLTPGQERTASEQVAKTVSEAKTSAFPRYPLPGKASLPEVHTVDPRIVEDPDDALHELRATLQTSVAKEKNVDLASAEFFLHHDVERLESSEGILADRSGTRVASEVVVLGRDGAGSEAETQQLINRRRIEDLNMESWVQTLCTWSRDAARAVPGPTWEGPVVLSAGNLNAYFQPLINQISAASYYQKAPHLPLDEPVSRGGMPTDPFHLSSDATLAYGTGSYRCDAEGVPGARVPLVVNGVLSRRWATQRFAHYVGTGPTGAFGNLVIDPGSHYEREFREESGVLEVMQFSWLNPSNQTGDYSSEVRFGYLSQGMSRTPIRGGLLTGNVFDSLVHIQMSRETAMVGGAKVPAAVRFDRLKLAGV